MGQFTIYDILIGNPSISEKNLFTLLENFIPYNKLLSNYVGT